MVRVLGKQAAMCVVDRHPWHSVGYVMLVARSKTAGWWDWWRCWHVEAIKRIAYRAKWRHHWLTGVAAAAGRCAQVKWTPMNVRTVVSMSINAVTYKRAETIGAYWRGGVAFVQLLFKLFLPYECDVVIIIKTPSLAVAEALNKN